MKPQQTKFSHRDISRALFYAYAPRVDVYPFWKSSVEPLSQMKFADQLSSSVMEDSAIQTQYKLARTIVSVSGVPISSEELLAYFMDTTTPLVNMIFIRIVEPYLEWKKYFTGNMAEFVKGAESKFQWEIAQSIGIDAIMPKPFSFEQRVWIAHASAIARNEERKFIIDIADGLKPWINNELYQHVERIKENKKTNVAFESQKKRMFDGSFGVPTADAPILRNIERQQVESVTSQEDDFDVIR